MASQARSSRLERSQQENAVVRRFWRSCVLHALLVAVLLAAQAFGAAHQTDLAAHSGDQSCDVCVSLASCGSANVAAATVLAPLALFHETPEYSVTSHIFRPLAYGFARGPPIVS